LAIGLLATGCNRPAATPGLPTSTTGGGPDTSYPTKDEVLTYLDGKTMPTRLPVQQGDMPDKDLLLKRDQITALEVDQKAMKFDDGPWLTDLTFLVNGPEARYAVRATVKHRQVEGKRAFFGVEFREVAKQ
jgi:hypothetical protein